MINYLALGDSLTVGVGAPSPQSGFVPQYVSMAYKQINKYVVCENFGVSGATSDDVLDMITNYDDVQVLIKQADIISITVGGNDMKNAALQFLKSKKQSVLAGALKRFNKNFDEIIDRIHYFKKYNTHKYMIRGMNLYNPFPNIPGTDVWVRKFNKHIQSFESKSIGIANVYPLFLGREKELLSYDQFHPNGKGYYLMATAMNELGYAPLVK
ncbi:GDSL-type esterase/lipase family protein [Chengkuizengella axinellae]|uniref:GDSL-type esterase/lipase family protein n=1 Tax=Chengkuizengella axinellae TaxID=3064388 RepID=A0ABT9J1N3_9BACL|nr:GDSL-type esterase/lipase family protein [Chengkuizengella sp. 2205SS18-9]MDP5275524.1 GDSL-type esterase/lipase family protein [Chengkuizengella sp. 2205SS18-9]